MSRLKLRWTSPAGEIKFYEVGPSGLSLGRSSSNDLHYDTDEALSRRHCRFYQSGESGIAVTDLASANGTFVNGTALDFESRELKAGDLVEAGEQHFEVIGDEQPASAVDLGLSAAAANDGTKAASAAVQRGSKRTLLWGGAFVFLLALAAVAFFWPVEEAVGPTRSIEGSQVEPSISSVMYEKIEADGQGIFRYAMQFDRYTGQLTVRFDDVPVNRRGLDKSCVLKPEQIARIEEIFAKSDFSSLDSLYSGADPSEANALKSLRIRLVRGASVKDVKVINAIEPETFARLRDALEAFSRNELGVWAVHFSREKLLELAATAIGTADAKYEEREIDYGNLSAAVAGYSEAMYYLETVDPKPDGYADLVTKLDAAKRALNAAYEEVRFRADKAINLQDWESASKELKILCAIVTDKGDERNREAMAKLLDVEKRLRKGAK